MSQYESDGVKLLLPGQADLDKQKGRKFVDVVVGRITLNIYCLLYTSPSPRD